MAKTLFLIDGHAEVYRSHFAMEGLSTPDGKQSGAIFGFARTLKEVRERFKPDYLGVAFDTSAPSFRHKEYPEYKAHRPPAPDGLKAQIPDIKKLVQAFHIPVITLDGFEADDLLGTLAFQAAAQGVEVVIVSSDKDLGQLLRPNITMYDARKGERIDAASFQERRKVAPGQFPDLLGLWGDASDNIPGVPGFGEKTAAELIGKYGSLEEIIAHADELKGKRGEVFRQHISDAVLSKKLATIDTAAPVALDLEALALHEPDMDLLAEVCNTWALHSVLASAKSSSKPSQPSQPAQPAAASIPASTTASAKKKQASHDAGGMQSLFASSEAASTPEATPTASQNDYQLVSTKKDFAAFLQKLRQQKCFAFDTETTGLDPMQALLVGMSFSWQDGHAYYLPFLSPASTGLIVEETEKTELGDEELKALAPILADAKIAKIGHNLKFDALVLRHAGLELNGLEFDTMLASHLLDGHLRGHGLDDCVRRLFQIEMTQISELCGSASKAITMDRVPLEKIRAYACADADMSWKLSEAERPRLAEAGLEKLLTNLEMPLSRVLIDMQARGVRVDCQLLKRMSDDFGKKLEIVSGDILALAGHDFNIASPKQLSAVLFDELKFEVVRKTETGRSTDEDTLTALAASDHPKAELPQKLLLHRKYSKLKNTYLDALPQLVNPATGRVHTTFNQTGTQTGRLSSSDPNLQNIPVRTEEGREIRAAFVPEPGWTMLCADYSQIELRLLAHFSGDAAMRSAFERGQDIHRAVAALVNNISEDAVTPEQRSAAKAVNFGIVYGQGAYGLSQGTGMAVADAKKFIDAYFAGFPGVKAFLDKSVAEARAQGYASTIMGRRREIPDLEATNKQKRAAAERIAVNTTVQGSAADLIKVAMINIQAKLRQEMFEARMLLQIHDELVFECPPQEEKRLRELVSREMETALPEVTVPLSASIGTGANWLEAK